VNTQTQTHDLETGATVKQVMKMGKYAGLLALALSLGACSGESAEMAANAHPGQSTYNEACISCHNPGISGAPRLGDTDAWQARAAKGRQTLVNSTINGLNSMPAKGMCWQCTDEDLGDAVDYILEQSGVSAN
jgi:cytochrome c5|tara:strand:+ start:157 stop:555 length:399 start_codon:yes stop_codon:yes gene_type:complete